MDTLFSILLALAMVLPIALSAAPAIDYGHVVRADIPRPPHRWVWPAVVIGPLLGGVAAWAIYGQWLGLRQWTWMHSAVGAGLFIGLHLVSLARVMVYVRRHPELRTAEGRASVTTAGADPKPLSKDDIAPSSVGDDPLSRGLTAIAGLGVLAMMALIGAEVIGRYLLGQAIDGKNDILGILLALTVFSALPAATWKSEHIDVDLLEGLIPRAARRWRTLVIDLGVVMCLGIITWWVFRLVSERWDRPFGAKVTPVLELPMVPVGYAIVALMLLSAVGLAIRALWKVTAQRAADPHDPLTALE